MSKSNIQPAEGTTQVNGST